MEIETHRLIIRSFVKGDIPDYCRIVSDPKVTQFLWNSKPHSREEARQYIIDTMEEESQSGFGRYAVIEKSSNSLIGFCGFSKINDRIDFGWRYESRVWGQGYGTEAALAVLKYGTSVLRLSGIVAATDVLNLASLKIIEKLDFCGPDYIEVKGKKIAKFHQK